MQDRRSLWLEAPNSVPLQCRSSPEELFARLPPLDTLGISFEDPDNPEPALIANTYDRWVATWFPPFLRWLQVCCGRDLRDCADLLCLFSDKGCLFYASHSIAHSLGSDLVHLSVEIAGTEALSSVNLSSSSGYHSRSRKAAKAFQKRGKLSQLRSEIDSALHLISHDS